MRCVEIPEEGAGWTLRRAVTVLPSSRASFLPRDMADPRGSSGEVTSPRERLLLFGDCFLLSSWAAELGAERFPQHCRLNQEIRSCCSPELDSSFIFVVGCKSEYMLTCVRL